MLNYSEWPDLHDPHRCGTAPFVPRVDGEGGRQNSCGSYEAGFGPNGCNKYRPNYPDDLYIEQHGCKGLADCEDNVPPTGDIVREGTVIRPGPVTKLPFQHFWPVNGYRVMQTIEGFDFSGPKTDTMTSLFYVGLIVGIVWLTTKR